MLFVVCSLSLGLLLMREHVLFVVAKFVLLSPHIAWYSFLEFNVEKHAADVQGTMRKLELAVENNNAGREEIER